MSERTLLGLDGFGLRRCVDINLFAKVEEFSKIIFRVSAGYKTAPGEKRRSCESIECQSKAFHILQGSETDISLSYPYADTVSTGRRRRARVVF